MTTKSERTGRFIGKFKRLVKDGWMVTQAVSGLLAFAILIGLYFNWAGTPVKKVEAEVKTVATSTPVVVPPILQKIAKCESKTGQYKDGQVTINATLDLGKFQINHVWFQKAHDMGYDLSKEEDNTKFAIWLFENKGTSPWSSSANCWNH